MYLRDYSTIENDSVDMFFSVTVATEDIYASKEIWPVRYNC